MANIKFSQFTVGNVESDIDFVVGYKGGDNIQISPANLLSATLTGYLPLTGGAMSGNIIMGGNQIKFADAGRLYIGDSNDLQIYHDGTTSNISNTNGNLSIINLADNSDIKFFSDDGSGGVTEYFRIDGGYSSPYTIFPNGSTLALGSDLDLRISHNGTDSFIDQTGSGNLYIRQKNDDKDIILESDDGSGGTTEYFRLDGSLANGGTVYTRFPDLSVLAFGSSQDLRIYHSSTNSFINNAITGDLYIQQSVDDKDIIFQCDDGAGGLQNYLVIDGSLEAVVAPDTIYLAAGTSLDLSLRHDGTNSHIQNNTGDLTIKNGSNDKDIIFQCDDGAGGLTNYFALDGSIASGGTVYTVFPDNSRATFGTGFDLQVYHDASNSYIKHINSGTGDLIIQQERDNGDIFFKSDDGAGGTAIYFMLDGSETRLSTKKDNRFDDNIKAEFGTSADLEIYHNGTNSVINNKTNNLQIINNANDGDISFQSDDGSGGTAEYFRVDGGAEAIIVSKNVQHADNVRAYFGNAIDLAIYHNGTASFINNETGDLNIANYANDSDIRFYNDDGAGSVTEYFRVDGGLEEVVFSKSTRHMDNVQAKFGSGEDLKIYHDGSNSYISDTGTGNLNIQGDNLLLKRADGSQTYLQALTGGSVSLYHAGNKKLETKSTGINIQSVPTYADNAAAIAGGLTTGDVYRTGDLLKIVH